MQALLTCPARTNAIRLFLPLFYQENKHIEIKNLFYKSVLAKINSNRSRGFNK